MTEAAAGGCLVLSLFPGLGLLDRAFEEAGFCVARGPDVLWGGDIRAFHAPPGVFDGLIGGPPCQTFSSLANLVRANGHEPRFGNLIPEFERCVAEAQPRWFLMENVPAAPVPAVNSYGMTDFVICNSAIGGEDGFGQEQERKRRFSFGVRGRQAPDLRRWIKPAALLLPAMESAVWAGSGLGPTAEHERRRVRTQAVTHRPEPVPVAIGGSGKVKRTRQPPVSGLGSNQRARGLVSQMPVTGAHQCSHRPTGGRGERRSLAEMCHLQGLPEDFLADSPFTMEGKRKAVANGVPLPTGRAVAAAVRAALANLERCDLAAAAEG